jgi:transcriptional regulator with XRE-family HTH domain
MNGAGDYAEIRKAMTGKHRVPLIEAPEIGQQPQGADLREGESARALRLRRKLTLDQLAELTGLSKGHLSRFERGEKSLSVAALMRLAQALGTSVSVLLGESIDKDAIHLVRVQDRRTSRVAAEEGGYSFALLSRSDEAGDLEVFTAELAAGVNVAGKVTHGGYESFFVLDGEVEIEVAERVFRLRTGDYIEFPGTLRHSTQSKSPNATVLVVVNRR